jgi:putative hydrolase of HD superfamily
MQDLTIDQLADAVTDLGRVALTFSAVNRTAVYWPDGATPESDTDHTVMLGWVACSLAARYFPMLDLGLVAQFALIHDAPEVYAGDTPTLRIDQAGRALKAAKEAAAVRRLHTEFGETLPWLPSLLAAYEEQQLPEARYVRGVDKILPKVVHILDGCAGLIDHGMGSAELATVFTEQQASMATYVGEFAELMALRAELVDRTMRLRTTLEQGEKPDAARIAEVIAANRYTHSCEADLQHGIAGALTAAGLPAQPGGAPFGTRRDRRDVRRRRHRD